MQSSNTEPTSTRTKSEHAYEDAKDKVAASASEAKDKLSAASAAVATRVEETAGQLKARGQELIDDAAQRANHAYQAASEYAHEAAIDVRERARLAGDYARRAGDAGVSFAGTHALPLTVIGLGLGWLALSVRAESRRREQTEVYYRSRPTPTLRGAYREPIASREGYASDATSGSPKLLGVRPIDVERPY